MLRSSTSSPSTPSSPSLPKLDIPFSLIRAYAGRRPRPAGLTTVHLVLTPSGDAAFAGGESPVGMEALAVRPTFPLAPWDEQKDVYFPALAGAHKGAHGYVLDFTDGGAAPGVVMSQSRMKEIEMVLNPFGGMESQVPIMGTTAPQSWVDMLVSGRGALGGADADQRMQLSPHSHLSPEYYTTVYVRPIDHGPYSSELILAADFPDVSAPSVAAPTRGTSRTRIPAREDTRASHQDRLGRPRGKCPLICRNTRHANLRADCEGAVLAE